jgi:hypothetical protein
MEVFNAFLRMRLGSRTSESSHETPKRSVRNFSF